jgi:hypothetical protein
MMTGLGTAVAASGTIEILEFEILDLDPDVAALIAEVQATLCTALTPARRPPAPLVTGSDFQCPDYWWRRRCAGPPSVARQCTRAGRPTWPSDPRTTRPRSATPCERQVMASQQT